MSIALKLICGLMAVANVAVILIWLLDAFESEAMAQCETRYTTETCLHEVQP